MKKIILLLVGTIVFLSAAYVFLSLGDYYDYNALSVDDCVPGEEYNQELGICYFDFRCENSKDCERAEERYSQVLDAWAKEYPQGDHRHHVGIQKGNTDRIKNTDLDLIAQAREQGSKVNGQEREIWSILKFLLPTGYLERITQISQESDGEDGMLAYVEPVTEDGSKWKLVFDALDTFTQEGEYKNTRELLATLIHEYAHVLTLNESQVLRVSEDVSRVVCEQDEVILDEGCAKANSYIVKFINNFWTEDVRQQAYEAFLVQGEEDFAFDLYSKQPEDFVTEYAATNAAEDLAESFVIFVMQDSIQSGNLAKEKVKFFYQYPELITLRKHMREGVSLFLDQ